MKKPNILDRAIMTMAPVHAAKRAAARVALSVIKSGYGSYGANLTKKSMRGWMYHGGSAKEDIEDNIDILQQRSRDAYMGIPTATAALKTMRTNVVAGGLMPAPQLDSDYLGLDETAVEKLQAQFVREFALWGGHAGMRRGEDGQLLSAPAARLFELPDERRHHCPATYEASGGSAV